MIDWNARSRHVAHGSTVERLRQFRAQVGMNHVLQHGLIVVREKERPVDEMPAFLVKLGDRADQVRVAGSHRATPGPAHELPLGGNRRTVAGGASVGDAGMARGGLV